jgi:uncharacterized Zn finger protein
MSGMVRNIIRNGNHFEGYVRGSEIYELSLDIKDDDLIFKCTRPYDNGGICKHSVAFGLAILEEYYDTKSEVDKTQTFDVKTNFKEC